VTGILAGLFLSVIIDDIFPPLISKVMFCLTSFYILSYWPCHSRVNSGAHHRTLDSVHPKRLEKGVILIWKVVGNTWVMNKTLIQHGFSFISTCQASNAKEGFCCITQPG